MNKRTKALSISEKTKSKVFERDHCQCVLCGSWKGQPNAHFIARSQGGLGIEQNIVTLCFECHQKYDNSAERPEIRERLREYLKSCYPDWNEEDLYYKKWQ